MWIDLHHHLLWGLDDGARSEEMTQGMLKKAAEEGVSVISATAHAVPGRQAFPLALYRERLAAANAWAAENGVPVQAVPGCEILYTPAAAHELRNGAVPSLNGGRWVLVEFSPDDSYDTLEGAARNLRNEGWQVVFAHIERYECLKRLERVEALRQEYRVRMQVNAATFIEERGFLRGRWLRKAMERELIDVAASDDHSLAGRRCRMGEARTAIAEQWGAETADALCRDNPAAILGLTLPDTAKE